MITIDDGDLSKHKKTLESLGKNGNRAVARALNRAIESGVVQATRSVAEKYYITPKKIKYSIKVRKANAKSLTAGFVSSGGAIPLIDFKTNPKKVPKRKPKKKLMAGVLKADGLKSVKNAFIQKIKSGKVTILQRTTDKSYPIRVAYGLSIPQMLGSKDIGRDIENRAKDVFLNRLEHEINRELR